MDSITANHLYLSNRVPNTNKPIMLKPNPFAAYRPVSEISHPLVLYQLEPGPSQPNYAL